MMLPKPGLWAGLCISILATTVRSQAYSHPLTNKTLGSPDAQGKYEISSSDIRALFIPYGASIANLFVKDKSGVERDIVLGFDNAWDFENEEEFGHPHLGGVPGACLAYRSTLVLQD